MAQKYLYIAYRPEWGDNRACDLLRNRGCAIDVRCPARDEPMPSTPDGYGGVIVGGALDDVVGSSRLGYVDQLIDFARLCLQRAVPFLGFCFGAQVLAAAGGGQVLVRADGRGAFGYRPLRPTGHEGRAVLYGLGHVYYLHYHGFETPPAGTRLATGDLFPDSAFRLGPSAFGFQFHPEIRADQVETILSHLGPEALERPGADPIERHLEDAARHDGRIHDWLDRFLLQWHASG